MQSLSSLSIELAWLFLFKEAWPESYLLLQLKTKECKENSNSNRFCYLDTCSYCIIGRALQHAKLFAKSNIAHANWHCVSDPLTGKMQGQAWDFSACVQSELWAHPLWALQISLELPFPTTSASRPVISSGWRPYIQFPFYKMHEVESSQHSTVRLPDISERASS